MISPAIALVIAVVLLLVVIIPPLVTSQPLSHLPHAKIKSPKILMEDALKFLYNHNLHHPSCSEKRLAAHLNISVDALKKILTVMRSTGYLPEDTQNLTLTELGNTDALRIIRVHRVLERYFAEETGIEETGWHRQADVVEHKITEEEVNRIAAQLGNPVFDPHGDPIPSPDGEIQHISGKDLSDLEIDEMGEVIHINDQPETIYAQLVAEGLHPGMHVRVLEKTDKMIRFHANGRELVLAPIFAKNVRIKLKTIRQEANYEVLTNLKSGQIAKITGIANAIRGSQRRRLMDLGVIPGATIAVRMKSMFADPIAYSVMGATIALRKNETNHIFIEVTG